MAKAKKPLITGLSRVRLGTKLRKPNETSLFRQRMRELDREFARQSKQLTTMTKRLKHKLGDHLMPPRPPKIN